MGTENSLTVVAKAAVNFLGRICNPAADEIGLLLQDKVRAYRNKNFSAIAQKAEKRVDEKNGDPKINPRILYSIYEHGSWSDSDFLQDMWAGLLASSCFDDESDRNMLYVDILSKISMAEASLFEYIAKNTEWSINEDTALPESNAIFPNVFELSKDCQIPDMDKLDEAMTHLSALGLIRYEAYPNIEKYTSGNAKEFHDLNESDFNNPGWVYSVECTLTQLGYRLFLKVNGESLGLKAYIQKNFSAKREFDFNPEWD